LGLIIEGGASFDIKGCADQLERSCIGAQQGDGVRADGVIADGDISHLDRTAGGGIFRQRSGGVGEPHRCWCLVQIIDREVVAGGDGAGAVDRSVENRNGEVVGVFGLKIEGDISLEVNGRVHQLKGGRISSTE
jgi:hypothetical protein